MPCLHVAIFEPERLHCLVGVEGGQDALHEVTVADEGRLELEELGRREPAHLRDLGWFGLELSRVDPHRPPVQAKVAVVGVALPDFSKWSHLERELLRHLPNERCLLAFAWIDSASGKRPPPGRYHVWAATDREHAVVLSHHG